MTAHFARTCVVLLLELAALALLVLVGIGRPWPAEHAASVYLLADRSASIPRDELRRMLEETASSIRAVNPRTELQVIDFAGRAALPRRIPSSAAAGNMASPQSLLPQGTNLAAAVQRVTLGDTTPRPSAIVVLSDGNATEGDITRALEGAVGAAIPVYWRTVAAASSAPRLGAVLVPESARPGQPIPVVVRMAGTAEQPVRVTLSAHDKSVPPVTSAIHQGPLGTASLLFEARGPGPLLLDVVLTDATTARVIDAMDLAAVIDVEPPADVLYVTDQPSALAHSLRAGGWTLTSVGTRGLDSLASAFQRYGTVVLDDVPVAAARAATWDALVDAVQNRGTGLLVLGGGRSFAAGSYRDSKLEAVLPVLSRPAALGDAAALAFVVDKSGSMGSSASGVDRFRIAQRAVVETAATLTERDAAALVVFDVATRVLVPLEAAAQFKQSIARPWATQPRGGTRVAPAIEMAAAQLETAAAGRRIMVLVTDGFVDQGPVDALRERLARARIELIALAVGPDADVAALARLVDPARGTILRVAAAAELPALMRSSVEMRRAPVERGRVEVRQLRPLPMLATEVAWPVVSAYAVTSPRPDAIVHLESARGDPLLVYRQAGLGRVVAVTTGLGAWTPDWLSWSTWPVLAGGLVEWVASSDLAPGVAVSTVELPAALRVDVNAVADGRWSDVGDARLLVRQPSGRDIEMALEATAPGRASALMRDPEPGLYTFTVVTPSGAQRLTRLHQPLRELGRVGPSPDIAAWRKAALIKEWSSAELARSLREARASNTNARRPLLLALVLFLGGVLLDRYPFRRRRPAAPQAALSPGNSTPRGEPVP